MPAGKHRRPGRRPPGTGPAVAPAAGLATARPPIAGLATALVTVLVLAGVLVVTGPAARTTGGAPTAAAGPETAARATARTTGTPAPASGAPVAEVAPTALRIPAIGVSTSLVKLGLDASGALSAPGGPDVAGWFAAGPVPGAIGPAILAGHVDSQAGPAVFFRLRQLKDGDEVQVDRSDGGTVVFRVVAVRTFPKDRFPTEQVYGPTPLPELRLVTCGGPFDRAGGRYLDNVIVQAVPVAS